jgi:hypothetical protein
MLRDKQNAVAFSGIFFILQRCVKLGYKLPVEIK